MKAFIVDASVAAKWFFPEDKSDDATRLITARRRLLAPDLISAEFGNVVWKRVRRGEISADGANALIQEFVRMPLEITPSMPLISAALELAIATQRTVYDCLYLALALSRQCKLITADVRLFNSLELTPLGQHVRLVDAID